MDPMLNKLMTLALKLEENAAYAIPTPSQHLYKKFPPRPAHSGGQKFIYAKLDQSKV